MKWLIGGQSPKTSTSRRKANVEDTNDKAKNSRRILLELYYEKKPRES